MIDKEDDELRLEDRDDDETLEDDEELRRESHAAWPA